MTKQTMLSLEQILNRAGSSYDDARRGASVNAWGNSFPAEELPFGKVLRLGPAAYAVARNPSSGNDNVEALGQCVALPPGEPIREVYFLCCGEMGAQELDVEVRESGRSSSRATVKVDGWLLRPEDIDREGSLVCSHLHYPGGYELDRLRPALHSVRVSLSEPVAGVEISLGINPLFHIFAVTIERVQ